MQYVFNEDISRCSRIRSRGSGASICADSPEDVLLFSSIVDSSRADHIRRYRDLEMWDDYCESTTLVSKALYTLKRSITSPLMVNLLCQTEFGLIDKFL